VPWNAAAVLAEYRDLRGGNRGGKGGGCGEVPCNQTDGGGSGRVPYAGQDGSSSSSTGFDVVHDVHVVRGGVVRGGILLCWESMVTSGLTITCNVSQAAEI
jgi:hypothetical protein